MGYWLEVIGEEGKAAFSFTPVGRRGLAAVVYNFFCKSDKPISPVIHRTRA
jgi:hypothetical protein